jgi:hypothetical protein
MHQLPIEQQILLVAQGVALAALCIRLHWDGLDKIYRYFFGYQALQLCQTVVPIFLRLDGMLYRDYYVASEILVLCLSALVVLELYSIVFRGMVGITSLSRRFVNVTLALAILISLLPLALEKTPNTVTGYFFSIERPALSSLLILVLLITSFLVYYPVPIGRNVLIYLVGYAIWLMTDVTKLFIRNLGHYWTRPMSDVHMGVYLACLVFWLLGLSRRGESKSVVVGHQWNPGDDQRLLAQLEAINASLLRSGGNKRAANG